MPRQYLKKAKQNEKHGQQNVQAMVQNTLDEIEIGGDEVARRYAREFDKWEADIVVSRKQIEAVKGYVSQSVQDDIYFAHDNIQRFAKAQKNTVSECSIEVIPGLFAGQKQIPISVAGCYVPGGRYAHIASALMTVTTAKVAGVNHITAVSPPRSETGIDPMMLFALDLAGADTILTLGGVQGIAAMAFGLFGTPAADILVGPGNQYVAEAKRLLFGRVGIDMVAGPTDSMVIADETADPYFVAWDLIGQAEHGYNSPVWLATSDKVLAERVIEIIPSLFKELPEMNAKNAKSAWEDYGEIILCENREVLAQCADDYAPEHLQVQAADLDWWLGRLRCYGSLFLGEETTVAFGDKSAGPNHVLPTSGSARYTGGLSVHKFMKTVTWQRATREGMRPVAEITARISRLEGMEGHAKTADIRLEKYFPSTVSAMGRGRSSDK